MKRLFPDATKGIIGMGDVAKIRIIFELTKKNVIFLLNLRQSFQENECHFQKNDRRKRHKRHKRHTSFFQKLTYRQRDRYIINILNLYNNKVRVF